ncbi:MAG TPA: nucleotide exchange factor GrpE [Pyrinomonadaceae bacterium]|nr:nucleotide exchange factor GrpE [Pyrinomonadaceae bacterium]
MGNKRTTKANRIPVHFVDDQKVSAGGTGGGGERQDEAVSDQGELSPEEIGRASSYEDETEMQRRIDRGQEDDSGGRTSNEDADTAGGPTLDELPERREDRHEAATQPRGPATQPEGEAGAPQQSSGPEATGPTLAELIATRAELRRVETEREVLRDALARRQAEFDNYRKRVERERGESYNRMVGDVVSKLLPVLDNLRRALDAEESLQANESEEFRHFLHGVELIYKQLNGVLEGLGLQPVAALGERFDPHVHEAVVTEQTEEYEPDTVIQEIVPGYRLGEKLLRPAVVKVATR